MGLDNKTVYLNGDYIPLQDAKISVLDRGFLFGDGIYEVIPAYQGRLFRMHEHLQRLQFSLQNIAMCNPHTDEQWRDILQPLLQKDRDEYIYLQITRGIAATRDHAFPEKPEATVFAMCSDIHHFDNKESGFKAVTLDDTRWQMCHIKATTLLGNVLLRQQAVEQNCAEAILIKDGMATEGAASNLFAVINGDLLTPPKDNRILPGITRDLIIELANNNGIKTREQEIPLNQLQAADEIWLTSSTREILPVTQLDNQIISNGRAGPVWHSMQKIFQDYKCSYNARN